MADAHLDRIERKIDALTDHVTVLDGRVGGVEQGVAGLDRRLKQVEGGLTQVDGRLKQLDAKTTIGFKDVGTKVALLEGNVDALGVKIDSLDTKIDSLAETQLHVNSDLSGRVQRHEQQIAAIENENAAASARPTDRPRRSRE